MDSKFSIIIETNKFLENESLNEIEKILDKNLEYENIENTSLFILKNLDLEDVVLVSYFSRTINKVLLLLELYENFREINNLNFSYVNRKKFAVRTHKYDKSKYNLSSVEISAYIGERILNSCKNCKVDLEEPDIIFRYLITPYKDFLTIDLVGEKPLYKRCYKLSKNINTIRPTIFPALFIRDNVFDKSNVIINNSGFCVGCIEFALLVYNKTPNYCRKKELHIFNIFDKKTVENIIELYEKKRQNTKKVKLFCVERYAKYLDIGKYMAKRALVEDNIIFRRIDTEWLDLKFKEGTIDYFFTYINKDNIKKEFIDNLFYVLEYICSKDCHIRIISNSNIAKYGFVNKILEKYKFKMIESLKLFSESSNYFTFKMVVQ